MKYAVKTALKTMNAVADLELTCDHAPMVAGEVPADRCEVVTDFHRLEELSQQWQRLWESDPRAEVFQTPEWARAWWHSFGDDYRLCSLVVFAGTEVIGILPLVERGRIIQFLGTPEGDYADVICAEHRATEVLTFALKTLLDSVTGWDECGFHHLSKHSRLVRYYRELPRDIRDRLHCLQAGSLQTIILRNQRDEVFKSLLGKHHTKRLQNKLRKAGDLQFRLLTSSREIEQYLPDFFRHHVRRHVSVGRRSTFADHRICQFLQAAIRELAPTDRVRFGVLELNRQPLAWNLGFEVNGKFLLYQHTFDLDAWDYTPGEVLLWNSLEYAKDHVTREFDFGRGDELYKDRFTNYSRETFSLFVEPRSLSGRVQGWKRSLENSLLPSLGKLKEVAKSRRSTLTAYRSVRMWMMGTSSCIRQARQNGALLQYGFRFAKELFGDAVWSRKSTEVFALQTSGATSTASPLNTSSNGDLDIRAAKLGDLADLSWEHPEILSLNELQECRKRLKNGDRVYIVREKSKILSVCWASSVSGEDADAPRLEIASGMPAMVVDEFWNAADRDMSAMYCLLLSVLAKEASDRKADLLVHCASNQSQLRKALECQGFVPKFLTVRNKVFRNFQRHSVLPYTQSTLRSSQGA